MAENGKLSKSELEPIRGGELSLNAAAAWKAPHGPEASGLLPEGPLGSYRDLAGQQHEWDLYQRGEGNLAAYPGTSNHGLGVAVDLKEPWMRSWIDEHGEAFGWAKTEAFSEWWHVNYTGSVHFPLFTTLKRGSRGKRVLRYTRRLSFIHREHGGPYLSRGRRRYGRRVQRGVRDFQRAYKLTVDGTIGPETGSKIDAVFHRQYHQRHKAMPKAQHSGQGKR